MKSSLCKLIIICGGRWNLISALLQLMFLLLVRHVIVIVRDVSMLQDATVLFSVSSTCLLCILLLICPLT
jgi:hypothetical protein